MPGVGVDRTGVCDVRETATMMTRTAWIGAGDAADMLPGQLLTMVTDLVKEWYFGFINP